MPNDSKDVIDILNSTIRAELAARKLTQADLAKHANISRQGLVRRFSCDTEWSVRDVQTVAEFLHMTIFELFAAAKERAARARKRKE